MLPQSRREFLERFVGGAVLFGRAGVVPSAVAPTLAGPPEPWLEGLTGKHRQFFDVQSIQNGAPLKRVANFLDAYRNEYAVGETEINVVFGAHANAIALALDDECWAKYGLGVRYGVTDPGTGRPATRNPFVSADAAVAFPPIGTSIEELQQRRVRFLACRNSLQSLARELSRSATNWEEQVSALLAKAILPGFFIVPAMLVAINRAQEAGLTYVCQP